MTDYALYHGDEFIAIGSIRQLAKRQNVKIKTIQYYRYKSYAKRTKNGYRLIKLED